jgi:hypothetical protein
MADTLQEMIANRVGGRDRARLIQFYISQGYEPAQATAIATAEMARQQQARQNRPEPGYEGAAGAEMAQMNQDYYRRNPSALSSERANEATLPGYDPSRSEVAPRTTYDPITNRIEGGGGTTQFSSPMTQEDINVARQTNPIPRGSAEPYGGQQPSIVERAIEAVQQSRPAQAFADSRQGPVVSEGGARPVMGIPSNYVGSADVDFSQMNTEPGFSGRGGDILQQAMRATAPAARPAARPAVAPIPERPAGRTGPNAEGAQGQSWFSNLFKDPYAGKSSQELFQMQQSDPDNKGLYFRAAAKQAEERRAAPTEDGMARGGTAGGGHGKDAAIMKALEIIHHMIRGR